MTGTRVLERAFELAKSGTCVSVTEIKRALKKEGYDPQAVVGSKLSKQLAGLIADSRRDVPTGKALKADLKRADAALNDNAMSLLATVFEASGDCIKVLDLDGRLIFMSEGGKRVMEVDDFEVLRGCPWPDLWQDEGNISARNAIATARGGKPAHFLGEANTGRGNPKFWDVRVLPIAGNDGKPTHLLSISSDITASKEAEARQRLLSGELQHRIKNTLTLVSAIASQTLQGDDIADRRTGFLGRLGALAKAHDILVAKEWTGAAIATIATETLAAHQTAGRVRTKGATLQVGATQALSLSLALHELATNAAKYGALSNETGTVALSWEIGLDGVFRLTWQETGGPKVKQPARPGFGTKVLTRVLAADFGGTVVADYRAGGLVWRLECPATSLLDGR